MNWQRVKTFGRRREVWGLAVMIFIMGAYWFHEARSTPRGVMLEFVGFGPQGTNQFPDTVMAFRVSNRSGIDITYFSPYVENGPECSVVPMDKNDAHHKVMGGSMMAMKYSFGATGVREGYFNVLRSREDRIVLCEVFMAEQSWVFQMPYWEGNQTNRIEALLPPSMQAKFVQNLSSLPIKSVRSAPVHQLISQMHRLDSYTSDSSITSRGSYPISIVQTNSDGRVTGRIGW
jgi:hypothetical protein